MTISQSSIVSDKDKFLKISSWIIISLGIFFRLFHYLQNRSLYTDEAYLANNLLSRDFYQLTQPLDASQHAPLLFLFVEKWLINTINPSEWVLRFFSFICGIGALISFYYLLKKIDTINKVGLFAGMLIFAFAFPLIYYSSELKQYSTEALCTILCYLLYYRFNSSKQMKELLLYSFLGIFIVWFSYSSIFVLASIGIISTLYSCIRKEWFKVFRLGFVYASWALSFLINLLFIIIPNTLNNSSLIDTWQMAYMPLSFSSASDIKWFINTMYAIFDYPLGLNWGFLKDYLHPRLTLSFIGLFCMVAGIYTLLKANKEILWLFIFPILLSLFASGLEKFPFTERFLLFLSPNFIILIAIGLGTIFHFLTVRYSKIWAYLIVLLLLFPPVITAAKDLVYHEQFGDWKRREIKDIMGYLKKNKQKNEYIFLYHTAAAFNYYNTIYHTNWPSTTILNEGRVQLNYEDIEKELKSHGYTKFWIVVVGNLNKDKLTENSINQRDSFVNFFDKHYKRIEDYSTIGAYTAQYNIE